jgi:GTP diphosphokinase / guanosine-3',5'-bis(diphosphate) 3'-diphosphatase
MRTLQIKKVEKRVSYANETLIFFSPLCERLGLYDMQYELEDLAFQHLDPHKYKSVKKLKENYGNIFLSIFRFCEKEIVTNNPMNIKLDWHSAPIYVSYSMLQEGKLLPELFTIQIITATQLSCYTQLGIIHSLFQPIPNRFRDEITSQRNRFNRHLNTSVLMDDVEVRFLIKTTEENLFTLLNNSTDKEIEMLSRELLRDSVEAVKAVSGNPIEFYELISFELLQNDITVYTREMNAITLPEGSTVLDFAYFLDPISASRMVMAKINGKEKQLKTKLEDMDIVEWWIEDQETVNEEWLNHVSTCKAIKEINGKL